MILYEKQNVQMVVKLFFFMYNVKQKISQEVHCGGHSRVPAGEHFRGRNKPKLSKRLKRAGRI